MARKPLVHKPIMHSEETRLRISAARIIDRLQDYALGGDPDAMSRNQVAAAIALLNKVLPSLQSVEVNREETKTYVLRAPIPAKDADEWLNHYGPKTINGTSSPSGAPRPARKQLS